MFKVTMGRNTSTFRSYLATPPADTFSWPINLPLPTAPTKGTPFGEYFDFFMDIRVPIAIAGTYATLVHIANRFRKTNKEPLAICKTKFFKWFVLAHNIGLCIYSAWTCVGMTAGIYRTVFELSRIAISQTTSASGVNDYLKGNSGLISSESSGFWRSMCDTNDGIWERGLAYYGYLFYLSKFYEVFDTIIILAKGRQSSMLQTYHHAGAMLSMWAGIRFASPPIWIFVVFNSLIHTIMYFYYTISALKIKVPSILKRALTTAQICQFVFGGSFAIMHVFVYYFKSSTGEYSPCLDNPGKVFALAFNVTYLAPLTYLFVMFWIDSYVKGKKKSPSKQTSLKDSALQEAAKSSASISTSIEKSGSNPPASRTRSGHSERSTK